MNQSGSTEINPPRMLTIRRCADVCPLSEYSLRLMLRQGRLPGIYVGNRFLVNLDRLLQNLNENAAG